MKKLGYSDPKWSLKVAVQKQVELEDKIAWAKRNEHQAEYVHTPSNFHLSETAQYVLGSSIRKSTPLTRFISSIMP